MAADGLLAPISGSDPGGQDLSEEQEFIELRQAVRPPSYSKQPDYDTAERLAAELLSTKSKDLQVAVFYVEALLKRQSFSGLRQGLELLCGLLDTYWDSLFPRAVGARRGPLAALGSNDFAIRVQLQPLNDKGHNFWQYGQASSMPTAEEAEADEKKRETRAAMLRDDKIAPEMFAGAVDETPKKFYKESVADLDGSLAAIQRLDTISKERFGKNDAPSYRDLRLAVEAVRALVKEILEQKLIKDPDKEPTRAQDAGSPQPTEETLTNAGMASATDAEGRVVAAAHYLRKANPLSPVAYLLLRGLRWGEMRASGGAPNEKLLAAPPPEARPRLRKLFLEEQWDQLLESSEQLMGTAVGRGWLDLQFYVVRSLEGLRDPYDDVRRSILAAFRALLADVPSLPEMTLMDAMPAASPETKTWIAKQILEGAASGDANSGRDGSTAESRAPRNVYALAQAEATAGKPEHAIEMLMRELSHETSERGRFLRRTQIATIMVDNGLVAVAKPLLQQLIEQIDKFSLSEWEDGAIVSQPLALMVRCLDAQPAEADDKREEYYLRVCTLNPIQAMRLAKR
jgi:type VI secretion system protein ImpA